MQLVFVVVTQVKDFLALTKDLFDRYLLKKKKRAEKVVATD